MYWCNSSAHTTKYRAKMYMLLPILISRFTTCMMYFTAPRDPLCPEGYSPCLSYYTNQCILDQYFCDGVDHCTYGSDEILCRKSYHYYIATQHHSHQNFLVFYSLSSRLLKMWWFAASFWLQLCPCEQNLWWLPWLSLVPTCWWIRLWKWVVAALVKFIVRVLKVLQTSNILSRIWV